MKKLVSLIVIITLAAFTSVACREKVPIAYKIRMHLEGSAEHTQLPISKIAFDIEKQPLIWEGDIEAVSMAQVELGRCICFKLNENATKLIQSHLEKRLILVVNDQALGFINLTPNMTGEEIYMFIEMREEKLPAFIEDLNKSLSV